MRVLEAGFPGIDVRINGRPEPAPTTRRAVELLVTGGAFHVEVEQAMELPASQGFGMSSAGALSAALATAEILGRGRNEALWAAHTAEVLNRTGLGDVVGAAQGGFELRLAPGLPPYGKVEAWTPSPPPSELLLCVVAPEMPTKGVLTDPRKREEINRNGARCVDAFAKDRSLSSFAELSRRFSVESRLAPAPVLALFDRLGPASLVAQCMLGGSVFSLTGHARVREELARMGRVLEARVDPQGARVTIQRRPIARAKGA